MDNNIKLTVGLIDPSIEQGGEWDVNTGDLIIGESIKQVLEGLCGLNIIVRVPSLKKLSKKHFKLLKNCEYVFVGGTNLLTSHMLSYRQWIINILDTFHLQNVILFGVGWWQYQSRPDLYTRILLRRILSRNMLHSVRDNYSKIQLEASGIRNVLNTSCPTLWGITPELQKEIPVSRSDEVITTVTCYNKKPEEDKNLIRLLMREYSRVYLWPQDLDDQEYVAKLGVNVEMLPSNLDGYDRFLKEHSQIDYIGKRLHAGIRAIQKRKRTLILKIDNRAVEISRDTNLKTLKASDLSGIVEWINSDHMADIRLPLEAIAKWVRQFRN